jgi:hypothetical protein
MCFLYLFVLIGILCEKHNSMFWYNYRGTWWLSEPLIFQRYTKINNIFGKKYNNNGNCKKSIGGWIIFLNVNWFLKKLLVFSVICQKKIRRVWRYQRGSQNPYIEEEQTTKWVSILYQRHIHTDFVNFNLSL